MKNSLFTICLAFLFLMNFQLKGQVAPEDTLPLEQDKQKSISVSFGQIPTQAFYIFEEELERTFSNIFSNIFSPNDVDPVISTSSNGSRGAITIEYQSEITNKVEIGIQTSYFKYAKKVNRERQDYYLKYNFISLMPTCKVNWFQKKKVRLYSAVAIGMGLQMKQTNREDIPEDSYNENFFKQEAKLRAALQLSPIGIEVKGPQIGWFLSIGTGWNGVYRTGLKFFLGSQKQH